MGPLTLLSHRTDLICFNYSSDYSSVILCVDKPLQGATTHTLPVDYTSICETSVKHWTSGLWCLFLALRAECGLVLTGGQTKSIDAPAWVICKD